MAQITINDFAKKAYKKYIAAGMTPAGACGLMGNQYAESAGFLSNRLEFLCVKRLKENGKIYTDETYTSAVDSGKISKSEFLNPLPNKQYGYGLSQWTSPGRKSRLYEMTVEKGKSIADEEAQLDFTLKEMKETYVSVWNVLKTAKTVKEASDIVLVKYECPADTGSAMKNTRADYGQQYYEYFMSNKTESDGDSMTKNEAIQKVIKIAEGEIGYLEKKSNYKLDSKTANAGSKNYTKYWRDVYPSFQGQAWCAAWVSWILMQAFGKDMAAKLLKHWPFVYCPTLGSLFTKNANPKVGDIVLFYRNGTFAHTGIVVDVQGNKFWTIEGNASGASGITPNGGGVVRKSYNNSALPGTKFCTPDWSLVAKENEETNPSPSTSPTQSAPSSTTSTSKKLNTKKLWKGKATSTLNVRTWAGVEYGTCSFSPLKKGAKFNVLDTVMAKDGTPWYYIKKNGKTGFVSSKYVKKVSTAAQNGQTEIKVEGEASSSASSFEPYKGKVTASALNIRAGAGTSYDILGSLPKGTKCAICEEKNGFGKLQSRDGWVSLQYIQRI